MAEPNRTLPVDGYVPILKGKQGELGALNSADPQRLLPLVEVIDCGKPKPLANAHSFIG